MHLQEALAQISEIRQQMAQSQVFRGYRAATTAFTAVVAVLAAVAQAWWVPIPFLDADHYLILWAAAALLGLCVVGVEMSVRSYRSDSSLQKQITLLAVDQFVPCIVAGALVTLVIGRFAINEMWMLP